MLNKHRRLCDIVKIMSDNLPSRSLTIKLRTGWEEKNPTTHKLIPHLQKVAPGRISAIMVNLSLMLFSILLTDLILF